MRLSSLRASVLLTFAIAASSAQATTPATCMVDLATTRNGTLGLPYHARVTPDGHSALFLRSGPRDTRLRLYRYDLTDHTDHTTHELAAPTSGPEHLSVEEKARRERARQSMSGITEYQLDQSGRTALASQAGHLGHIDLQTGKTTPVPGNWSAPRRDPACPPTVKTLQPYMTTTCTGSTSPRTT